MTGITAETNQTACAAGSGLGGKCSAQSLSQAEQQRQLICAKAVRKAFFQYTIAYQEGRERGYPGNEGKSQRSSNIHAYPYSLGVRSLRAFCCFVLLFMVITMAALFASVMIWPGILKCLPCILQSSPFHQFSIPRFTDISIIGKTTKFV